MTGRLDLRLLRRELDRLLAEVEARRGQSLEIEADHYWLLESSDAFDVLATLSRPLDRSAMTSQSSRGWRIALTAT